MKMLTLEDVLNHEIEDLHSAETQILEALPLMAKHATSSKLRQGFEKHLKQTQQQLKRLEDVAQVLEIKVPGKVCKGMKGLLAEGAELLKMEKSEAVDAALISAAQRVEHYEIAGYGSAITFAKLLKHKEVVTILKETLAEEVETDKLLTTVAKTEVNKKALEE